MKACFQEEYSAVIGRIPATRGDKSLCFALMSDSCLSNELGDTLDNMKAVDEAVNFDCLVHLGNALNGVNPRDISMKLLQEEFAQMRTVTEKFYPTIGLKDGYRDESFCGQIVPNIMTNELWYRQIQFLQDDATVTLKENQPYYYVDFADKKIRLIFLCSFITQIDEENRLFVKVAAIDIEQARWFKNEALDLPAGWTTVIFSNTVPKSRFNGEKDPFIYRGYSAEMMMSLIQKAKKRGVETACWIAGGYNADAEYVLGGIPYVSVAGQLATLDTTMKYEEARFATERTLNTRTQDCWDSVILDTESRTVRFVRFGSGEDRTITY